MRSEHVGAVWDQSGHLGQPLILYMRDGGHIHQQKPLEKTRRSVRPRARRTETDLGSTSLENSKGFQNQGGAFLKNMLASTSLKAPGQDLFIILSQQFQKCCLSRPLPYHEPLQSSWRLCISSLCCAPRNAYFQQAFCHI